MAGASPGAQPGGRLRRGGLGRASLSASALVANAVWPSCHRNSRLRMNGVGCLNSQRTTLHHWFSFSGRSRWLRTHCA